VTTSCCAGLLACAVASATALDLEPEAVDPATKVEPTRRSNVQASVRAQPPRPRVRGLVRGSLGLDGGAAPRVGAAFEAAAGALGRGWRAEATALYRLATTAASRLEPGVGGRILMWALGGRGCGVPARGRVEVPLCIGIEGGTLVGDGYGFMGARRARRPWGAVTFAPQLAIVLNPNVAFVVQAVLGVALVRPSFFIEHLETVHRVGPVLGRAFIGLEGRFP
jgi:hypothetical protein